MKEELIEQAWKRYVKANQINEIHNFYKEVKKGFVAGYKEGYEMGYDRGEEDQRKG